MPSLQSLPVPMLDDANATAPPTVQKPLQARPANPTQGDINRSLEPLTATLLHASPSQLSANCLS